MISKRCIVCHEQANDELESVITCSFCGSLSHLYCVEGWLAKYNKCPFCQNIFTFPKLLAIEG